MAENLVKQHVTSDGVLTTVVPVNSSGGSGTSRRFEVRDEADNVLLQIDGTGTNTALITAGAVTVSGPLSVTGGITVNGSTARVSSISQSAAVAQFTDNGDTTGTFTMTGQIPAGATVLGTKLLVSGGFGGDTSAVVTIGDGVDVDRYHTGTPDVFTAAATGVQTGAPSGDVLQVAAVNPVVIVTTATDFGLAVTDGSGELTITIYYLVDS